MADLQYCPIFQLARDHTQVMDPMHDQQSKLWDICSCSNSIIVVQLIQTVFVSCYMVYQRVLYYSTLCVGMVQGVHNSHYIGSYRDKITKSTENCQNKAQ